MLKKDQKHQDVMTALLEPMPGVNGSLYSEI
jgi:hypothetical protein